MPTIRDEIFRLYPLHAQRIFEIMEEQAKNKTVYSDPDFAQRQNAAWLACDCYPDLRPRDIMYAAFILRETSEGQEYWARLAGSW